MTDSRNNTEGVYKDDVPKDNLENRVLECFKPPNSAFEISERFK
jgi:hypothetical protein